MQIRQFRREVPAPKISGNCLFGHPQITKNINLTRRQPGGLTERGIPVIDMSLKMPFSAVPTMQQSIRSHHGYTSHFPENSD
jgi:hypothetical protein